MYNLFENVNSTSINLYFILKYAQFDKREVYSLKINVIFSKIALF